MRRSFLSVLAMLCVAMLAATPAAAEKRVALVIGMGGYQHVGRLANPANDARLMADTLRGLGFTLVGGGAQLDLDKTGLDRIVQSFGNEAQGADAGLFYYAGHGVQVKGSNYLIPIDANPVKESDIDFQMMDVTLVLRQMESSGIRLNIVILDACRNNPFAGRGLRALRTGLAEMETPDGTVIAFATKPGAVAMDGADGNSPYTKALAQTVVRRPELGIFDTFNEVGRAVQKATGQKPWFSASPLEGNFHFATEASVPIAALPASAPAPQPVPVPAPAQQAALTPPTQKPASPPPSAQQASPASSGSPDHDCLRKLQEKVFWEAFHKQGPEPVVPPECEQSSKPSAPPSSQPATLTPPASKPTPPASSAQQAAFTPPAAAPAPSSSGQTKYPASSVQCLQDKIFRQLNKGSPSAPLSGCEEPSEPVPAYDQAFTLRNRGFQHFLNKDYDRAIADYNEAIRIFPADYIFRSRGDAYFAKKDYARAIADYGEAVRLYEKSPLNTEWDRARALFKRGLAKQKSGDRAGADDDMKTAKALKSDVAQEYARGYF